MHVSYISAQTAERRRAKMEDVTKRSEYRKVHGIGQEEGVFGNWTAKSEREVMGPAFREGEGQGVGQAVAVRDASPVAVPATAAGGEAQEGFLDFDGKQQPASKKWFGIW